MLTVKSTSEHCISLLFSSTERRLIDLYSTGPRFVTVSQLPGFCNNPRMCRRTTAGRLHVCTKLLTHLLLWKRRTVTIRRATRLRARIPGYVNTNPSLWLVVVPVILYDRPTPPPMQGVKACQNHLWSPYYTSQLLGLREYVTGKFSLISPNRLLRLFIAILCNTCTLLHIAFMCHFESIKILIIDFTLSNISPF